MTGPTTIAVTGASGRLGHLVIEELVARVPARQIVAAVRRPERATRLAALDVQLREADYTRPETLRSAFGDAKNILLISASDIVDRFPLHKAVVDAAKDAAVELFVYTSLLRADRSQLLLAREHLQTEAYIRASGLPFVILRNGWYLENHTASLGNAVAAGALVGSSGDGRFASASRIDYATAAAVVLTQPVSLDTTYELAGDHSFSMTELAAEVSRQSGRDIPYRNVSRSHYAAVLAADGLPQATIDVILDADAQAMRGDLDSSSRDLHELIRRPTMTRADAVRRALHAR